MTHRPHEEKSDIRLIAEEVADVLAERGLVVVSAPSTAGRVLNAAQVAALLGRNRQWVYDHARELGAFRYGSGPRARLGFDVAAVHRWKAERDLNRASSRLPARRHRARLPIEGIDLIPYEGSGTRP